MKTEIIAEIGQNHNGDMELAVRLIRLAKDNGADVAKFQLFDARALFPPREQNPWYNSNCKAELSREQVRFIADECGKAGIEFMASIFDLQRIEWLEDIGVRRYKLAARSSDDQQLIRAVLATRKPVIASIRNWSEARQFPDRERVDFLHCVSKYPAALDDMRLASVDFTSYAGLSDHTLGLTAPMTALARGARIIEKHFTLDQNMHGPDHSFSMTPPDLARLHQFRTELEACL